MILGNVVRVLVGVMDGPTVRVRLGVRVRVAVVVGVGDGVAVNVEVDVDVDVTVCVRVGVGGGIVAVRVGVGDKEAPTRRTRRLTGPGLPSTSRTRTETIVSPMAKAREAMIRLQY